MELGFAAAAVDDEGGVTVELRLPTYWCAANFAYLMASDARAAVAAVPGVRSVTVRLHDHYAGDDLADAVNAGRSLDEAFAAESDGSGLDDLRRLFVAKAFISRQEQLLRRLLAEGRSVEAVCAMRLADLDPDEPGSRAYLDRRRRLGLPTHPDSPLAVRPNGEPIEASQLERHLSRARLTRVGMAANASLCSGLHATRYAQLQRGSRPPLPEPPLSSGMSGAPSHPAKSAPLHRDFAGTPGSAHRFAAHQDVRDPGKTDSHTRAKPLFTAARESVQDSHEEVKA